ncbi:phosphoethanolamine transferase, partial [Bisgaard Taxon 45]
YKPVKEYLKGRDFSFLNIRVYPIQVVNNIHYLTSSYFKQKDMLDRGISAIPDWKIQSVNSKYDNYVLVIGESMRADYMSVYGYPIETTPFLNRTKETIFTHYISSAPNTQPSLLHTLYDKENDNIKPNNNIINLANYAGFNTYWFSNQGILGYADTAASRIGLSAQYHMFTKKGGYDDSRINDFKLLEYFDEFLLNAKKSKNLFIFHLMGSHADFCTRLSDSPEPYFINKDMTCYLETIKQTDLFLEKLIRRLGDLGSYSVIYFSDHGLSHYGKDDKDLTLKHNNKFKENYHVPFIQISSDDTAQKRIHVYRSGMDFLNGFAEWLGIEEPSLTRPYSFFSEDNMNLPLKVFDWEKYIDFDLLPSDPALLPEKR